jgi:hypothetical protein
MEEHRLVTGLAVHVTDPDHVQPLYAQYVLDV